MLEMTKSQWPDELQIPNVFVLNGQYVRILFEEINSNYQQKVKK